MFSFAHSSTFDGIGFLAPISLLLLPVLTLRGKGDCGHHKNASKLFYQRWSVNGKRGIYEQGNSL